jgi:acyl-CoA thioesterase
VSARFDGLACDAFDASEERRMREQVLEKSLDLVRVAFDIDLDGRSLAKITHRTRDAIRLGDVDDAIAISDVLYAPSNVDHQADRAKLAFFLHERFVRNATSRLPGGSTGRARNCARVNEEDALAARVVAAMFDRDRAAKTMGIELHEARAGFARIAFVVREDMLNAHDTCHGGYVFALADAAFAYACNSRNDVCLALQCSISFAGPSQLGARLVATARERALGGRTGTYDVEVTNDAGTVLAFFRGTSYRVSAKVI